MFERFQLAVRNAYLDLKNKNELHFGREWPSTGMLKNWCLTVYNTGISKEDELIYNRIFNQTANQDCLETAIKNYDPDKFRPLRNFIIGETKGRPDENLVKLLAILIDFNPRPYHAKDWEDQDYKTPQILVEDDIKEEDNKLEEPKKSQQKFDNKSKPKNNCNTKECIKEKTIINSTFFMKYKSPLLVIVTFFAINLMFDTYIVKSKFLCLSTIIVLFQLTVKVKVDYQKKQTTRYNNNKLYK